MSDADAMNRAVELVAARGAAAQLCVLRHGEVVLDRSFGCDPTDPFLLFSAGKPLTAMLIHVLASRGVLALDEPVARLWPEFAGNGKGAITIRQVLQHRAGVPVARSVARDAMAASSWSHSIVALERARPRYSPGQVPAYHILSFGFILGEVAQRATGVELPHLLRTEFFDPLGMADSFLGLPDAAWDRHVPLRGARGEARVRQRLFNRRSVRQAAIPAATVSSTARDLARFYRMLLEGGRVDGREVIAPASILEARQPSSDGELDRLLRMRIRWSQGFQLGGAAQGSTRPPSMGETSSRDTFGHNGSNCTLAWADPGRDVVVAYLTNRLSGRIEGSHHQAQVSDAILAAIG